MFQQLKNCLTVLLLLLSAITAVGQNMTKNRYTSEATEFIRVKEYHHAIALLNDAAKYWPEDATINYLLGKAYLYSPEDGKAHSLKYLLLAQENKTKRDRFDHMNYLLGRAEHYNHRFDDALAYYEKAKLELSAKDKEITQEQIDRHIFEAKNGQELIKSPLVANIENMGTVINSPFPEISPVIAADESRLVFTSRREGNKGTARDHLLNLPYEDVYEVVRLEDGGWSKPRAIDAINTTSHDASISLSPDGQSMFIYRDEKSNTKIRSGNIYISQLKNGEWTVPEKLPEGINTSNWETHATITSDGKTMIFVSNRQTADALGQRDLYIVRKLPSGDWALPQNMGSQINTKFNEESPFLHPEGHTLYFSSEGHNSMGGYDIFFTTYNDDTDTWSEPENIGYPINTADDDVFYTLSADGTRGYFSSVRNEGGGHDLYKVTTPQRQKRFFYMHGDVYDSDTQEALRAKIEVLDNLKQEKVNDLSANEDGGYALYLPSGSDYNIRFSQLGYLFKSYRADVQKQTDFLERNINVALQPLQLNRYEILHNVFFTPQHEVKITSYPELEALVQFMDQNPEYIVELAVHTSKSDKDSMLAVYETQARADALVRELKRLGADEERTLGRGYGFGYAYPIATNLTPSGRKTNERVEYIVRENTTGLAPLDYTQVNKNIFSEREMLSIRCPQVDEVLDEKVLFSAASNDGITAESAGVIEKVAELMELCPSIKVEIAGYTDDNGSADYQKSLSQKRAQHVKQQLVVLNIAPSRLSVIGIGNVQKEGSLAGDRNRVEFKVTSGNEPEYALTPRGELAKDFSISTQAAEGTETASVAPTEIPLKRPVELRAGNMLTTDIFFDFDQDNITSQAQNDLNKIADVLKQYDFDIEVQGFTDAIGTYNYNNKLGERRAQAVYRYLIQQEIAKSRLSITSLGETQAAENASSSQRAKERRVQIKILN